MKPAKNYMKILKTKGGEHSTGTKPPHAQITHDDEPI